MNENVWRCLCSEEIEEEAAETGAGDGGTSRPSRPRQRIRHSRQRRGSPSSPASRSLVHRKAARAFFPAYFLWENASCEGETSDAGATLRPSRPRERIQRCRQRTGSPPSPAIRWLLDRAAARTPSPTITKGKKIRAEWETGRTALKAGNRAAKR